MRRFLSESESDHLRRRASFALCQHGPAPILCGSMATGIRLEAAIRGTADTGHTFRIQKLAGSLHATMGDNSIPAIGKEIADGSNMITAGIATITAISGSMITANTVDEAADMIRITISRSALRARPACCGSTIIGLEKPNPTAFPSITCSRNWVSFLFSKHHRANFRGRPGNRAHGEAYPPSPKSQVVARLPYGMVAHFRQTLLNVRILQTLATTRKLSPSTRTASDHSGSGPSRLIPVFRL